MLNEEQMVGKEPLADRSQERVVFPKWKMVELQKQLRRASHVLTAVRIQLGFSRFSHYCHLGSDGVSVNNLTSELLFYIRLA